MQHPREWLAIKKEGLYCIPGGFFIDPIYPVNKAIITHGHGDHARSGHHQVLAHEYTVAIMQTRYGMHCAQQFIALSYFEKRKINGVTLYLLPAGHILGSAQIVMELGAFRLIISGDYKRSADPTCDPFVVQPCDVFITEATFSLPVFRHPPIELEVNKLLCSLKNYSDRAHLVGVYALGKCQRLIKTLRLMGYEKSIYLHGALIKMCDLYQSLGIELGNIQPALHLDVLSSKGKLILCPPSALQDRWSRRFANPMICMASGWMQIRARAKQKRIELPLIISDHADWRELTQTIHEVNPKEVWVTHGREEALVYHSKQQGYKAQALHLLGYDDPEN